MLALCLLFVAMVPARAVEFNTNVVDKSVRDNVDFSWFSHQSVTPPGQYLVTVAVNGRPLPDRQLLTWRATPTGTEVCIPPALADHFGLTDTVRASLNEREHCLDFSTRPDITLTFHLAELQLDVAVPQAWLAYHADRWTPPAEWSAGIPGFVLDYSLFASSYQSHGYARNDSLNAYGTTGLNLGAWRLRSDYQLSSDRQGDDTQQDGDFSQTYLFRPLPTLGARLTLGETNLKSSIFDTFSFTGLALNSDERMLPWELRGYAPQVSGIARTRATVIIRQEGRIIYQTSVAPGPFVIRDLNQTTQGILDVTVTEADGQSSTWQVSAASVPFLTRKGQVRYNASVGRARPDISHHTDDTAFIQAEASWGVLSQTSLYGGVLGTGQDYHALALGLGQNLLWFGAISADVTRATSQLPDRDPQTGNSYRLTYSRLFEATGSQISLAALRHSDRQFISYADYVGHKYGQDNAREKQSLSFSGSQSIPLLDITLYASVLRQTWWDDTPSTTENISLGYHFDCFSFRDLTTSLSFSNTHYSDEREDDRQWYVSLSVPIDTGHRLNYDLHHSQHTSQSVSWNDTADPLNTWSVATGKDNSTAGAPVDINGSYQHITPAGEMDLAGSWQENEYQSLNASWNGSLTATPRGWALHRKSIGTEPRLLVSTDGVGGIPVNGISTVTNHQGYAVLPDVTSYQPALVSVDMDALPDGVTVSDSVFRATWIEGSIGYRRIRARGGDNIYAEIRTATGTPPLGASVRIPETDEEVGMVSEGGHAWLTGVKEKQPLRVVWGGGQCTLTLPALPGSGNTHLLLPCRSQ
ncbi:TPA: fimbria/pilus outer membrane usher protein [Citrobacter werkmanii]